MDNMSAIDLAYNPEHHACTKHIDRRHFFVRERVEALEFTVPFVNSAANMADFFSIEPLPPKAFFPLRDRIMNVDRYSARPLPFTRGGVVNNALQKFRRIPIRPYCFDFKVSHVLYGLYTRSDRTRSRSPTLRSSQRGRARPSGRATSRRPLVPASPSSDRLSELRQPRRQGWLPPRGGCASCRSARNAQ
eukprot:6179333-Pleurochrysis_carterae.AAC.2